MSYTKLIHDYLDVGLDEPMQEALFMEIARNPELRLEFNNQLKIHNVASQDLVNIKTPDNVTGEIFQNLGFKSHSISRPIISKSILLLLIGIFSGGLISIATINYINRDIDSKDPNTSVINNNLTEISKELPVSSSENLESNNSSYQSNSNSEHSDLSNISSNANSNASILTNNGDKRVGVNSNRNSNGKNSSLADNLNKRTGRPIYIVSKNESTAKVLTLSSSEIFENSTILDDYGSSNTEYKSQPINTTAFFKDEPNNLLDLDKDYSKYHIGIKQLNYSNQTDLSRGQSFNNIALSFVYKFYNGLSFVLEAGREDFFQQYEQNISGASVLTSQEPTMYWLGGGFRYTQQGLFKQNLVSPFIQIVAAGTTQGPILRPQIGLNIRVSKLFSITSSYERPVMFFGLNGNNYTSSKNMFSLGFNLNL